MNRPTLVVLTSLVCLTVARGQTAAEKKATVAYLRALQTKKGGFLAMKLTPQNEQRNQPSLRATTAALRALRYFGGNLPDKKAARKFVLSCLDRKTHGFADVPGRSEATPIVAAIGLMAMVELKLPIGKGMRTITFLEANANSFEEIRMAAAAFETIQQQSKEANVWMQQIYSMHNEKGTYGKGTSVARDTAGSIVTILRLGGKVPNRAVVLTALKEGQRKDGGFGKADSDGSDLETCYRVVRAFVMLKEKPANVPALRKFMASCRNTDGGYGITPGQPSNVGATYFAGIILHWLGSS
jgi:prenyltransferase beta subunit